MPANDVLCATCQTPISDESRHYQFQGLKWHENCFKCSKCDADLVDKLFACIDGNLSCPDCFNLYFAPDCAECDKKITAGSKRLSWLEKEYHITCLTCNKCGSDLGDERFFPDNDALYCKACWAEDFASYCRKCNEIIDTDGCRFNDDTYHADCFLCSDCNQSLRGKKFTVVNRREVCYDCYMEQFAEKCGGCDQLITGEDAEQHMTFEAGHWHSQCLKCCYCGSELNKVNFIAEGTENGKMNVMCIDCGLTEKGIDPEQYRDNGVNVSEYDVIEETGSENLATEYTMDLLKAHNVYRDRHGVPRLQWSDHCAEHARFWAKTLAEDGSFRHSFNLRFGENIARSTNPNVTADEIVYEWYKEKNDPGYDFTNPKFQKGTGHFTQVVWKSTQYAGFAVEKINDNEILVVGNYKCPANMLGQFQKNVVDVVE